MALLKPNVIYTINGVTVREKIIPDGTRWKDSSKAAKAGFSANSLYKKQKKLSGNTGKVKYITVHNTDDLKNVDDDAEQYTRATYNENMGSARVHFYIDDIGAWQNLKAGTGMCLADPEGSAEVGWHAGDGSVSDGGNMTSIGLEIIMNDTKKHDAAARDNGARIVAWLLWKHDLTVDHVVTHTYWVNKSAGHKFADADKQSTNLIYGKKWCPMRIFGTSYSQLIALANWKAFKDQVDKYLEELKKEASAALEPTVIQVYRVRKTWDDAKSQKGAYLMYERAEATAKANPEYRVYDNDGNAVYPTVDMVAREIISGKWGTGNARKTALEAAGYNYKTVQTRVNELMR